MKSNIDIMCRIIMNQKSGTIQELHDHMVLRGRNRKHISDDIKTLISTGIISISANEWKYEPQNPLWKKIILRLNSASNQEY